MGKITKYLESENMRIAFGPMISKLRLTMWAMRLMLVELGMVCPLPMVSGLHYCIEGTFLNNNHIVSDSIGFHANVFLRFCCPVDGSLRCKGEEKV